MKTFLQTLLLCALAAVTRFTPCAFAGPSHEVMYAWQLGATYPASGLVQGANGSFYGTTKVGGTYDLGTVFRITPAGVVTVLVHFTGNGAKNKGSTPLGGLIKGSDGNFYGTTYSGGANGDGTVFKMTPAGVLTTLVEFNDVGTTNKGSGPEAALVLGSDGNFYGTTTSPSEGTVFKMTPAGVLTTLVVFTGNGASNKGEIPLGALVEGTDGNFYGTTQQGGAGDYGTVFKMTPAGVLTTLVEFTRNGATNKGWWPRAGLVQGNDGNFYGTTSLGGASEKGTVFRMTPAGVLTTLVEFTGSAGAKLGRAPYALRKNSAGDFFGTTFGGGFGDEGTVFKMTPAGVLTTLAQFGTSGSTAYGVNPPAGLVEGSDGNFYGTASAGGATDNGTVFQITPAGVLTKLADFVGTAQGVSPQAGLQLASDGNFYGTVAGGGEDYSGAVFRITPAGAVTKLLDFEFDYTGASPKAPLVQGADGNFYGTTNGAFRHSVIIGGSVGNGGTVFKLTPAGVLTTLRQFDYDAPAPAGSRPLSGLVQDTSNVFYSATSRGGSNDNGTLFKITSAGAFTRLVAFTGNGSTNKGKRPVGELVKGSDGNFYGTTEAGGANDLGTVFKMTPAGELTTLVQFTGNGVANKGAAPRAGLVQVGSYFYGTTSVGGASNLGTVFKINSAGALTTLVEFTGNGATNKGSAPQGALVRGADGLLYGTTFAGGSSDAGTLYRLSLTGALTTLVNFLPWPSSLGIQPQGALVKGKDNNLYGTTVEGGAGNGGTVFRLRFGPTPVTQPPTSITATSATLRGSVNPRGNATTVTFQYGISPNLNGATSLTVGTLPAGTTSGAVSLPVGGLARKTRYYFRVAGKNAENTVTQTGNILSFTTLP